MDHAKQLRTMALVCLLLGPILAVMAFVMHGGVLLYEHARTQPHFVLTDLGPLTDLMFSFAARSFSWMVGLGVGFTVTGFLGRRPGRSGRLALIAAGWIGVVGMVVLTVIWMQQVERLELSVLWHVLGVALHGIQLVAIARGLLYLSSRPVIETTGG